MAYRWGQNEWNQWWSSALKYRAMGELEFIQRAALSQGGWDGLDQSWVELGGTKLFVTVARGQVIVVLRGQRFTFFSCFSYWAILQNIMKDNNLTNIICIIVQRVFLYLLPHQIKSPWETAPTASLPSYIGENKSQEASGSLDPWVADPGSSPSCHRSSS